MATSSDAVASTSRSPLDALSPDSAATPRAAAGPPEPVSDAASTADLEPIPTLASLLLSTAESLASRSTSSSSTSSAPTAAPARPAVGKQPAKAAFSLSTSPQSLLNHPAAPPYLSSLLAQPLSALQSLPTSLATLSTSLDNDLSSLAFTRYSSFLLSYTAAQSISTSFTTLSDSLSALLDSTSALETAASSFEARVLTVREKRERMARVRERVEEVEELLEAPSVVDACVRAGHWSEAIDVAVRLEDLHKRLAKIISSDPDGEGAGALRLVNRVRGEVGVALLSLRARVLESLLQRFLKLPGAVRGVGILRRIAERGVGAGDAHEALAKPAGKRKELDEDALRVVFLVARWRCLRTELESVEAQMAASGIQLGGAEPPLTHQDASVTVEENEERTRWTKRWIEVWREVVGDTVGMFAEVFLASSHLSGGAKLKSAGGDDGVDLAIPSHALSPSAPLHLFLSTSLNSLASVLTRTIASLSSTASLSSLLTQLTYCSHSFARYGLDFRDWVQLRERIELRIGRIVAAEWETAGRKWEREWRDGWENSGGTGTTAAKARRAGRVPLSDWLVAPEGVTSLLSTPTPDAARTSSTTPSSWHHQPSPILALLPPIARFLNAHATALNALRLIPPVSLYLPLRRAQAVELDRATQVLAAFTDAWLASLNATPLPSQSGFEHGGANGTSLSGEEQTLVAERDAERRVVACAIAWFGRAVVPWCEGALDEGVYAELGATGRRPAEASEREKGIREAVRRCEALVARIEGRELEVEDAPVVVNGKAGPTGAPERAELPVLDAPTQPRPSSPTAASPVTESSDEPVSLDPTVLLNGSAKPVDFAVPDLVDPPQPSLDVNGNGPSVKDEGDDAPYMVDEVAPPAPLPADESEAVVDEKAMLAAEEESHARNGLDASEIP
ncbi:hypothetical protein JCM3775_003090 [Rhodotorula graminis]